MKSGAAAFDRRHIGFPHTHISSVGMVTPFFVFFRGVADQIAPEKVPVVGFDSSIGTKRPNPGSFRIFALSTMFQNETIEHVHWAFLFPGIDCPPMY